LPAYSTYSSTAITLTNFSAQNPITITPTGTIAATAAHAIAVDGSGAYAWTIDNQGFIAATGSAGTGVYLGDGGMVTNQSSAVIAANAETGVGVLLTGGGSLTNQANGTISAYVGVYAEEAAATVVNAGTLAGNSTNGAGIVLLAGGLVSNAATGIISAVDGVFAAGAAATLINAGVVIASYIGAYLRAGGSITNQSGGTIYGYRYGIKTTGADTASGVTNLGTITGEVRAALAVFTGGSITNAASGQIAGGDYGILTYTDPATITNFGMVTADNVAGVVMFSGGSLVNQTTGTILGGAYGVAATHVPAAASNFGVVGGAGNSGMLFLAGGYLNNAAGATVFGSYFGVKMTGTSTNGAVVNDGTIFSTATFTGSASFDAAGVAMMDGGTVANGASGEIGATWKGVQIGNNGIAAGGTLFNQGLVYASNGAGSTGAAVWIYGPGLISNAASGTIVGGPFGIVAYNQTTVVNLGSIGGSEFAFDAIRYGYANRMVVAPGAAFSGIVSGGDPVGATVASTLELATGAAAGTLTGLGTQFVELANVTIDAGAAWVFVSDAVGAGYTITDSGTLTNTGSLGSAVTVSAGAVLTNAAGGMITGGIVAGPGASVVNAGSISGPHDAISAPAGVSNRVVADPGAMFSGIVDGGNAIGGTIVSVLELASGSPAGALTGVGTQFINFGSIEFDPGAAWLVSGSPEGLAGDISGFAQGDTIEVTGITATGSNYTGGILTLDEAVGAITLDLTGSFSAGQLEVNNVAGGVLITVGASSHAAVATWSHDLPGDFSDPTKWSSGAVPGAATDALIDFPDAPLVIHDTGDDTVASLTNTAGDFVMTGGTLGANVLANASELSWTGGALVLTAGTTTPSLTNAAGATFSIAPTGQRLSAATTGASLSNAGTVVVAGASGTANIDLPLLNTGLVSVTQGTLSLNGGGSSNGYQLGTGPAGVLQFGTTATGASNTFSITGGFYAPANTEIGGGTLDVSQASAAVFTDTLAIGAGALTLGTLVATAQGSFSQTGGTLAGSGTLSVFGGAALSGGTETGAGTTALLGGALIDGPVALDGGHTLLNQSRLNWSSGNIALGTGDPSAAMQSGTLANAASGLLYITADGTVTAPGSGVLSNAGVMVVYAGAGTTAVDAALADTGVIQLQSGTLSLNGGGSANASGIFADPAAVLRFGTTAAGSGGTLSLSGAYIVPNTVVDGSTLDLSGASTVLFPTLLSLQAGGLMLGGQTAADQDAFTQTGGTLWGSGTLTVYGVAGLAGGVESGSGTTQLYGVSTIGGGFALDGGRTLATAAWLNWSGGDIALGSGDPGAAVQSGTLSIGGSGVLFATSDGRIGGTGVVANAGVLAVLGGAGVTRIDAALDNTGVIQVQSGTLSIDGGGTSSASNLFVASGAVLQVGTTASGGSGTFAISGGGYTVGQTVVQGGTLDLSAAAGAGFGTSLTLLGGGVQLGALTASAGVLVQSGGTLAGGGFFFVGGAASLSGGVETGAGVTVLTAPSLLSGAVALDGGRTLANGSDLVWTGGTLTLGAGDPGAAVQNATFSNSGTLLIEGTGTVAAGGGGLWVNSGLVEQVGGLGVTTVGVAVSNSGTIEVASGGLTFAQGVNGGGTFLLAGTATLDFVSGVSGGGAMTFLAPGGTLETQALGNFGALVSGFGVGDALDLTGVSAAAATRVFNAGTLTVSDGTNSAGFVLTGSYSTSDFVLAPDGHGGTRVTFG
jgi:hypothetical protein